MLFNAPHLQMHRHLHPQPSKPAMQLTHHQIIELAVPFTSCGHALDLKASDRMQRRLVFHGVQHKHSPTGTCSAGDAERASALREELLLENLRPGHFRLTRTLLDAAGLQATLQAEGERPAELLAALQAVPPQRHFQTGSGYRMAISGSVAPAAAASSTNPADGNASADSVAARVLLTHARVQMKGLTLTLGVSCAGSALVSSAALHIQTRSAGHALPVDLLAVLGWDWSLLRADVQGWQGSVRVRGGADARGDDAEHKLHAAAVHLARTLNEPPPCFDERQRSARLWVLARHAMPLLACALLGIEALFADVLREARTSPLTLALMSLPPAMLLHFMLRSERPRLALPTWPRPLAAQAWGAAA